MVQTSCHFYTRGQTFPLGLLVFGCKYSTVLQVGALVAFKAAMTDNTPGVVLTVWPLWIVAWREHHILSPLLQHMVNGQLWPCCWGSFLCGSTLCSFFLHSAGEPSDSRLSQLKVSTPTLGSL